MEKLTDLNFNPKPPTIMHLDLNSCFASIEQQANPLLRGKPIAVAAYASPAGCIIAPSVEAKGLGIRVGMRVREGKLLCKNLVVLSPDPNKYRTVHLAFKKLLGEYTNNLTPKSIDEFVIDLEGYPSLKLGMRNVAEEIKLRIKKEIGEWLKVSIGIGPNRFLAKTGASYKKPDGLTEINHQNYLEIYSNLKLVDLCGIKLNNAVRLNNSDIHTVLEMFNANSQKLKSAFNSVVGYHWYLRLHGFEVDDVIFKRKSYGNSYAIPDKRQTPEELSPILSKLTEKMGSRLRHGGFKARGVHLGLLYKDGCFWHHRKTSGNLIFDSRDFYKLAFKILTSSPYKKPVHTISVSCFDLEKEKDKQLSLMDDISKKERLVMAIDKINERWGDFVITPARMIGTHDLAPDRIAFGGVKELEEYVIN